MSGFLRGVPPSVVEWRVAGSTPAANYLRGLRCARRGRPGSVFSPLALDERGYKADGTSRDPRHRDVTYHTRTPLSPGAVGTASSPRTLARARRSSAPPAWRPTRKHTRHEPTGPQQDEETE